MVTYKTFSVLIGLAVSGCLLFLVRRSRLHSALIIWWSAIIALMLVFAFFPVLIDVIGKYFHISYPPIMISVIGLGLILIKILSMDVYITRNESRARSRSRSPKACPVPSSP